MHIYHFDQYNINLLLSGIYVFIFWSSFISQLQLMSVCLHWQGARGQVGEVAALNLKSAMQHD